MDLNLSIEVRRLLKCANCLIYSNSTSSVQAGAIEISPSAISVSDGNRQLTWDLSSQDFIFLLDKSSRYKQFIGAPPELRLRICEKPPNHISADCKQQSAECIYSGDKAVHCRGCLSITAQTSRFRRILPLPSFGWADIAENVFCHGCCSNQKPAKIQKTSIQPKTADLLVGTFTLLTRLSSIQGASSTGADKAVCCQKCGSLLGSLNSSWDTSFNQAETDVCDDPVVELYQQRLAVSERIVPNPDFALDYGYNLEHELVSMLSQQNQSTMTYKYLLGNSSKNNQQETLILLWLIELDIEMVLGDSQGHINTYKVIKVMYNSSQTADPLLVDEWKKDNKVTALPLPVLTTCDIITILRDNADMLPPNRTAVENMKVSILKTSRRRLTSPH